MKKTVWLLIVGFVTMLAWSAFGVALAAPAAPATKPVMYFWGEGCPACKEAAPIIERMVARGIVVEKHEIYSNKKNMDNLAMLYKTQGVPESQWAVPVAFHDGKAFIGISRLEELEQSLPSQPTSAGANKIGAGDLAGIMGAALADSVNPCAILVLVMLLTFTSINQESSKRLIWTAAAFIISVFVTYMLVGIGIVKAMTFLGVSDALRTVIGLIAVVVGLLNIKDWFAYRAGGFAIEIPRAWRPVLYKMIRKATSPLAAAAMGIFATLVELPCTGGPYFFALGLMSKLGMTPAFFGYLALYNFVFVSPLLVISVLVYLGKLTLETATDWQAENSRRLHLVAGLLMLAAGIAVFAL